MEKKTYLKPAFDVVAIQQQAALMQGSQGGGTNEPHIDLETTTVPEVIGEAG